MRKAEKLLFYAIVFLTPVNLGKHFILESSYVYGKLIDYLIPTIYVQDILIAALIIISIPGLYKSFKKSLGYWEVALSILFLTSILFSILSTNPTASTWAAYGRLILYAGFGFYTFSRVNLYKAFPVLLKIFAINLFLLSILGLAQWHNKGSVFNNYLVLGEQPYNISTYNITRVSFRGFTRVPPYGLFRHPNTFAAYLVFCILFILAASPKKRTYYIPVVLGTACLFLTYSRTGILALFIGSLLLILPKRLIPLTSILTLFLGVLMNIFIALSNFGDASVFRRRNLILAGVDMIKNRPLFGVGINNFVRHVDRVSAAFNFPRFTQPIHNAYLLILAETGIFATIFLVAFLTLTLRKAFHFLKQPVSGLYPRTLIVLLIVLMFLAFFDHFPITSHQINILIWLTLGLTLQYNLK